MSWLRYAARESCCGVAVTRGPRSSSPTWAVRSGRRRMRSIPKGEYLETEDELTAAKREFLEEIGVASPELDYTRLGEFRQSSGKIVVAFAAESDLEVGAVTSNTFTLEWPPRSGRLQEFPEIDDARWFDLAEAGIRLVKGQAPILDALRATL
jgi:predicted NUDIX family NTP pyrophosphohydrolase